VSVRRGRQRLAGPVREGDIFGSSSPFRRTVLPTVRSGSLALTAARTVPADRPIVSTKDGSIEGLEMLGA